MQLILGATPDSVRNALAEVRRTLAAMKIPQDIRGDIELVLAEALNNVVEHAYDSRGDGPIGLCFERDGDFLHCQICDRGARMPGGRLPMGREGCRGLDPAGLPEGGFGWPLIRDLAQDLRYERRSGQNHLIFRISLADPAPGEQGKSPA